MSGELDKAKREESPLLVFRQERRRFCGWATSAALLAGAGLLSQRALAQIAGASRVAAARLWPADEYTRLTLETVSTVQYEVLLVQNPSRVVLDLQGVEISQELKELAKRVSARDPYIQGIRVGLNRPGVTRLVIDLKQETVPQIFTLPPVAGYGHRLVLDLYPLEPRDPLLALLEKEFQEDARPGVKVGVGSSADSVVDLKPSLEVEKSVSPSTAPQKIVKESSPRRNKLVTDRLITIAIDPGHGGEDPGAVGHRGTYEKEVTLAIARQLRKQINALPNMRAMLTRNDDYFVPLQERVHKARAVNADLFISIHADAFVKPNARGSSVFVLSEHGASSAAAKWLAQRENSADLIGGINLKVSDPVVAKILLDLSQTATRSDSIKLAKAVLGEIGEINALHKAQVEHAGFAVLKAPDIPSILVETAFISNPEEEKRLRDQSYQEKMASSILGGVQRYFAKNPPLSRSRLAQLD